MKPKNVRDPETPTSAPASSDPRKRFRIERLEERIAPKKGGKGTHNCSASGGGSATGTGSFSGTTSY